VMIHCAVILITISVIMSVSLIVWLLIHAYEIISIAWHETKRRRNKAARLGKINNMYTVNQ